MKLIISDVIVLLMDQVSYTRTPKDHMILIIIMSKALVFLSVEFKKKLTLYVFLHGLLNTLFSNAKPLQTQGIAKLLQLFYVKSIGCNHN